VRVEQMQGRRAAHRFGEAVSAPRVERAEGCDPARERRASEAMGEHLISSSPFGRPSRRHAPPTHGTPWSLLLFPCLV
jgi:hypothetical protein